jgi:excisionase family DNA binding protein
MPPSGTITKKIASEGRHKGALTAKELAGLLSISTKTLYKMIKQNRIPCMRIGDLVRFDRQITSEWIRARWS